MAHNRDAKWETNKNGVQFLVNEYPLQTHLASWFCFWDGKHERFDSEKQAREFADELKGD